MARIAGVTIFDDNGPQPYELDEFMPLLLPLGEAGFEDLTNLLHFIPPYGKDDFMVANLR